MGERWRGWVTVRPGRLLCGGVMGTAKPHAHNAVQLLFASAGELVLRDENGAERACSTAVIPANVSHAIVQGAPECLLVLLDPDLDLARALDTGDAAVQSWVRDWNAEPARWADPSAAEQLVATVAGGGKTVASKHPALRRALEQIPALLPGQVRLSAVAQAVHLSPSRLGHLFRAELGLPFRPYVLWIRLHRAVALIGSGLSLTEAAYRAGFADAAHMTKTFHRMFGSPPSALARDVRWRD